MLYLIFLISLVSTQSFAQNSETKATQSVNDDHEPDDSKCSAPGKGGGSCVSLYQCPKYLKLNQTQKSLSQNELNSLKNAYCGYSKGEYFVCCKTDEQCGNSIIKSKPNVIGGKPAILGEWPWMAAIYLRETSRKGEETFHFQCGGTLISKEWVLTAAHCVPDKMSETLSHVRFGDLNLNPLIEDEADPIDVEIVEVIKHPRFSASSFSNDIALVRLKRHVNFTDHIRPICLHTDEKYKNITYYDRKRPSVIGWGSTENASQSDHLLQAEMYVTSFPQCAKSYKNAVLGKQENIVCASARGTGGYLSDSGGPLMVIERESWYQIGIFSFGNGDSARETYLIGVYTKVVSFINWINEKTGLYS